MHRDQKIFTMNIEFCMKQILIVDDSETSILYLKMILRDYNVVSALNGTEMWERLRESIPSLILMDVMLPDVNGYELVKQLSNNILYKDIPIIFQTAKSSSDDLEKGFESGAIDYVRKPVDKKELRARIKSVLKIKDLENELYLKSITDYLTGIYNRRYFFEIASKTLEMSKLDNNNFCIALIDIDFFKKINDEYGHDAGDYVLKQFSEIVKQSIRQNDIFARYGGEEFILLFPNSEKQNALEILEKIQFIVRKQILHFNEEKITFTFSSGLSISNEITPDPSLDPIIKIADERLYKAKHSGRDQIIIT